MVYSRLSHGSCYLSHKLLLLNHLAKVVGNPTLHYFVGIKSLILNLCFEATLSSVKTYGWSIFIMQVVGLVLILH